MFADRLPPFLRLAVGVDWEKTSLKPYVALLDAHSKGLMEEARRRKRGDKNANVTTSEPAIFPTTTFGSCFVERSLTRSLLTLRLVMLGPAWLRVRHHFSWLPLLLRFVRSMCSCRSIGERYGGPRSCPVTTSVLGAFSWDNWRTRVLLGPPLQSSRVETVAWPISRHPLAVLWLILTFGFPHHSLKRLK